MAMSVADSGALILPILTLMRVPVLIPIMQSIRSSPIVGDEPLGNAAIDPEFQALRGFDLDLVVRVGGIPGAEFLPVPVVAHDVAWPGVVEDVDGVFVGAVGTAEAVGG